MWNPFRGLFASKLPAKQPPPAEFTALKEQVEGVLRLDLSTDELRKQHEENVLPVLVALDGEINRVTKAAGNYPEGAISADVWMDGVGYAGLACGLAGHFRESGWLELEHHACSLWAKSTLAVASHYRHMVGPAMLAAADCYERQGNSPRAAQFYTGVVRDFVVLLEMGEDDAESLVEEDRLALESLQTALQRLLSLGTTEVDGADLSVLQSRLAALQ